MTDDERLPRFTCESYCRCGSRQGHFEKQDNGVWVRHTDVLKTLDGCPIVVGRGSIEMSGLAWQLRAANRATNQDLRAIAALLIAAADRLEREPDAVDTKITA